MVQSSAEVTVKTTVDPMWIEHCLSTDVFLHSYSGYWAYGFAYDSKLGWLLFEQGDERRPEKAPRGVMKAWRAGEKLPEGWHRLDVAAATAAWQAGVRRSGEGWFEDGDGNSYDLALQQALLGEIRYG